VYSLIAETGCDHVRDLKSFIISMADNSLKHALAFDRVAILNSIAAQLDEVVVHSPIIWRSLHMLNKVDLEDINNQVFL